MNGMQGKGLFAVLIMAMAAVALADPEQDTGLAEKAFNAGDLPKTLELLRKAAAQSYVPAQVRLGEILDYAEEDEEAVRWFNIAVEQGSAAGELNLGAMYLKGEGVGQDFEKALYWIRRAAEQNYFPAAEFLARGYRMGGLGSGVDIEQAQLWEARASAMKNSTAAENPMEKTKQGEAR